MQGRLSIENNLIQSFPSKNWQNEICLASKNSLDTLEWTIDYKDLYKNPILNPDGLEEVKKLKRKYNICIPSLTGDCFMQKPFWKESKSFKKLQDDFINILYGCKKVSISIVLIPLVDNGSIENAEQEEILFEFLSSKKDLIEELSLKFALNQIFLLKD